MRGNKKCGTCLWFEDKSEDFRAHFVPSDGFCHWRMPATVAKDSQGWGSWHQKGPASVRKEDWCSCWQMESGAFIDVGRPELSESALPAISNGDRS